MGRADEEGEANNANAIGNVCTFYIVCHKNKNACEVYLQKTTRYKILFCVQCFIVGNNVDFLGPHCRSDRQHFKLVCTLMIHVLDILMTW